MFNAYSFVYDFRIHHGEHFEHKLSRLEEQVYI